MSGNPEAFRRQRKNIIAISILYALYLGYGIELKKINLLGNDINISEPHLIPWTLFILWLYFLKRYWELYKENERRQTQDKLDNLLSAYSLHYVKKMAEQRAKQLFQQYCSDIDSSFKIEFKLDTYNNLIPSLKTTKFTFAPAIVVTIGTDQEEPTELKKVLNDVVASISQSVSPIEKSFIFKFPEEKAETPSTVHFINTCKAFNQMFWNTSLLSEYYLPFLLAILPWATYAWT